MADEEKPVLPRVFGIVDRILAIAGPPPVAPPPDEGEDINARLPAPVENPPVPSPSAGTTIALVTEDQLHVKSLVSPVRAGVVLKEWHSAGPNTVFTYADSTTIVFYPALRGGRGAYRVVQPPPPIEEPPKLAADAPPVPRPGAVLPTGLASWPSITIPSDARFVRAFTSRAGSVHTYEYALPDRALVVEYMTWTQTWRDASPEVRVAPPSTASGPKIRSIN